QQRPVRETDHDRKHGAHRTTHDPTHASVHDAHEAAEPPEIYAQAEAQQDAEEVAPEHAGGYVTPGWPACIGATDSCRRREAEQEAVEHAHGHARHHTGHLGICLSEPPKMHSYDTAYPEY